MDITENGGIILAGKQNITGISQGSYLIKTDTNGNITWSQYYPEELSFFKSVSINSSS